MFCWLVLWRCRMFQTLWLDNDGAWSGRRVVWRWQRSIASNPSTCYLGFRFLLWKFRNIKWLYELKMIYRQGNSRSHGIVWWCGGSNCATKRGYHKLYSKERHIVGLANRLWKVTAVAVTTWHVLCAQYNGMYELPEESQYFSYLPVEYADWIAHERVTAEKHFIHMSFWKWCRPRWLFNTMVITPSFLPTLRPFFLTRSGGKLFRRLYIRPICLELSQMRLM